MKSIKNHVSLIVALLSILFSLQILIITDRSIDSYKKNLANNYSIVIVSQKLIKEKTILSINPLISAVEELKPDSVIKRLNATMSSKNVNLLKLTLPKFYKLNLAYYPSPLEIKQLTKDLLKNRSISKIEDFAHNHDIVYKLLVLFKDVISVLSITILIVTTLLIFKELRIWQFKHSERMNIMGLFGAPVWLRSAVLFRLAIVDAFISTILIFVVFKYLSSNSWIIAQFSNIGIKVDIFNPIDDLLMLFGVAIFLSVMLATLIVIGHKEEV